MLNHIQFFAEADNARLNWLWVWNRQDETLFIWHVDTDSVEPSVFDNLDNLLFDNGNEGLPDIVEITDLSRLPSWTSDRF